MKYLRTLVLSGLAAAALLAAGIPCHAQFGGATVTVQMVDAVDSSRDPIGKTYRATVVRAINPGQNVTIANGSAAVVVLSSASTLTLTSLVVNGQPTMVNGSVAGVASAAQNTLQKIGLGGMNPFGGGKAKKMVYAAGGNVNFLLSSSLVPKATTAGAAAPAAAPAATPAAASAMAPAPAAATPATAGGPAAATPVAASGGYLTFYTRLYTPNGCSHNGNLAVCSFTVVNRGNDATINAGGGPYGELGNLQFIDDAHVPHGPQGKYFIDKYGTRQGSMVLAAGQTATFLVEFPNVNPAVTSGDFQFGTQFLSGISVQGPPTASAK
jgi:hypothetical protein